MNVRSLLRRSAPWFARKAYIDIRRRLGPPPLEEIVLHPYALHAEKSDALRLTLVIPTLAPEAVFAGIATGIEIFFECGRRTAADLRIVLDDFRRSIDQAFVEKYARQAGVDPCSIAICNRSAEIQSLDVRPRDIFIAYNWWTALNLMPLIRRQHEMFGGSQHPLIYIIQDYEPGFYAFSSTHLFARAAFDMKERVWGIFNSSQLHAYCRAQGHVFEREHVFEPRLSAAMRPFLLAGPILKQRQILVYARPSIARNCFSAVVRGLRAWTEGYPEFGEWSIESAGVRHRPTSIGDGREMSSLGKLPLEDYAQKLRTSAIGISLMSSPHPSYPPLEMAHFGLKTLTNGYLCKDLSSVHDNIVSLPDIAPEAIADALAKACADFEDDPAAGWRARSHLPAYLESEPYPFLDQLASDIVALA